MHQANAGFNTRLGFAGRTIGESVPAGQACFQLCCPGRAGPGAWLLGRLRNLCILHGAWRSRALSPPLAAGARRSVAASPRPASAVARVQSAAARRLSAAWPRSVPPNIAARRAGEGAAAPAAASAAPGDPGGRSCKRSSKAAGASSGSGTSRPSRTAGVSSTAGNSRSRPASTKAAAGRCAAAPRPGSAAGSGRRRRRTPAPPPPAAAVPLPTGACTRCVRWPARSSTRRALNSARRAAQQRCCEGAQGQPLGIADRQLWIARSRRGRHA